jgi:hypothetical protein
MKIALKYLLLPFILFTTISQFSQVGIGTPDPDNSSVLDLVSVDKGFLMPRLSATQISNITSPAKGLIVFNITTNDSEVNIGTSISPLWIGIKRPIDPMIYSVNGVSDFTALESVDLEASDLTLTPTAGTFLATFNGHLSNATYITNSFDSDLGLYDLTNIYEAVKDMATAGTQTETGTHSITFGDGANTNEVIVPGVYETGGAITLNGSFTLAGGVVEDNPIFIFRGPGAFTTAVGITITLTGNAKPENIFWMSDAAMATGAGAGAVSTGAGTELDGRLFTKNGTITTGASTKITVPTENSSLDFGSLSTFAMWSSAGGVSDVATAEITGDVGNVSGILSMTGTHVGEAYPAGTQGGPVVNVSTTTYSIYTGGSEVANSRRTIDLKTTLISIQTLVTVASDADPVELRWRVNKGSATLSNRFFSLIRSEH